MRIIRHWQNVTASAQGAVVAIGNFDGLHRGHQAVIDDARRLAAAAGLPLAILTFEPHPRAYFGRVDRPFRLTPCRAKLRVLDDLGVDLVYLFRFDAKFAAISAEDFVQKVLVGGLRAAHVVVGYDFSFGQGRAGNVALLQSLAAQAGFKVTQVAAAGDGSTTYSASEARRLLEAGEVAALAQILGRWWSLEGRVLLGDQRGRTIGFPTANLSLRGQLHPARGVYALWARVDPTWSGAKDETWHPAVANLGRRPTFAKDEDNLEVHVFDFERDIYGARLDVRFVAHIRPEVKFDGIDALKAQIARDCDTARKILAEQPGADAVIPERETSSLQATS